MGFNVSHEAVIICIEILVILYIRSAISDGHGLNPAPSNPQQDLSEQNTQTPISMVSKTKNIPASSNDATVIPPSKYPLQNFLSISSQQDEILEDQDCHDLRPYFAMKQLKDILSPNIFSQTDIFHYFLTKIVKIKHLDITTIRFEVKEALTWKRRLPPCYIPYARVLSSFLQCWNIILNAKWYIEEIQNRRSKNVEGFASLPVEISSSSELSGFFSSDIFSDAEPPSRIFIKILDMPKSVFANSKIQLENFVKKWKGWRSPPFPRVYLWYAGFVNDFLQHESDMDNLKRGLAEIQPILVSDQGFT